MKILITGAGGFIGKNLKSELVNRKYNDILEIEDCSDTELLNKYVNESDFIFHLQTIYRAEDPADFERINTDLTKKIIDLIGKTQKSFVLLSSKQAETGSSYGSSKLKAEEIAGEWGKITGNKVCIFRLANEFGKWCPPKLNSVVATFCDNISNNRSIQVNDPSAPLTLMYIDDIIDGLIKAIEEEYESLYAEINPVYETTVGELAETVKAFYMDRKAGNVPEIGNELIKKLYSTYLSYLPEDDFSTTLESHTDERGFFTELIHLGGLGQVSINSSKPGVTKGNHWHHTKTERFIVVKGTGVIRFRKIGDSKVIEYFVSGDKIESIDIPPGYTHNITNTGDTDMLTVIWANEIFDSKAPDTYFEEV